VIAVTVLAVVLVRTNTESSVEGQGEYVGSTSGLTFKYPSSWEKKDFAYLKTLANGQEVDPSQGNEIVLLKRGSSLYRHLLVVSSRGVDFHGASWTDLEPSLRTGMFEAAQTQGSKITFINPGLRASTGAHVIALTYIASGGGGPRMFQIEADIVRGNIDYTFGLTTPLVPGASDEADARNVFTRLINSVTFNR
jgi:hypothetical protein